ncbi:MAG: tRNA 4-thiouridine(8) synthase ThiI [Oscillospiraceae bacterium]|nr:tRNA 4-thiouridine(8) synthase ThiI [Candidatus Equicaccousia limihippi]
MIGSQVILIKSGELILKGLNRVTFESMLIKNLRTALKPLGECEIHSAQSTIWVDLSPDVDVQKAEDAVSRIFGIANYSLALECEKDIEKILAAAPKYLESTLKNAKTFKVESKRSDKKFPLLSPEISREVGASLLSAFHHLKVDVHNPDVTVTVEIRDRSAFIRKDSRPGAGGLPCGSAGDAAVLISGGIDSPVAAYMMAKRGIRLTAIHFASPPYTSERAELKVKNLLAKVARYSGRIKLFIVPFTEIQTAIAQNCPEEYFTLIMRRMMMRISQNLSNRCGCKALITGESLGQVASQTLPAMVSTDSVLNMPVFRPLIGMDKGEITVIARNIDTFETSILPYEDCCTVFTPRHPRTNPKPEQVAGAEANYDFTELIEKATNEVREEFITAQSYLEF